jgi:hypothetical protein
VQCCCDDRFWMAQLQLVLVLSSIQLWKGRAATHATRQPS